METCCLQPFGHRNKARYLFVVFDARRVFTGIRSLKQTIYNGKGTTAQCFFGNGRRPVCISSIRTVDHTTFPLAIALKIPLRGDLCLRCGRSGLPVSEGLQPPGTVLLGFGIVLRDRHHDRRGAKCGKAEMGRRLAGGFGPKSRRPPPEDIEGQVPAGRPLPAKKVPALGLFFMHIREEGQRSFFRQRRKKLPHL